GIAMGQAMGQAMSQAAQSGAAVAPPKAATTGCVKCGKPIAPGARFCAECGAAQAATCPRCQARLDKPSKFCPECGAPQSCRVREVNCPGSGVPVTVLLARSLLGAGPVRRAR